MSLYVIGGRQKEKSCCGRCFIFRNGHFQQIRQHPIPSTPITSTAYHHHHHQRLTNSSLRRESFLCSNSRTHTHTHTVLYFVSGHAAFYSRGTWTHHSLNSCACDEAPQHNTMMRPPPPHASISRGLRSARLFSLPPTHHLSLCDRQTHSFLPTFIHTTAHHHHHHHLTNHVFGRRN